MRLCTLPKVDDMVELSRVLFNCGIMSVPWCLSLYAVCHSINRNALDPFKKEGCDAQVEPYNRFKRDVSFSVPQDATLLDYLNIANSKSWDWQERGDVCRHFARRTFDMYRHLVRNSCRRDLEDEVRLCGGSIINVHQMELCRHAWIEYKYNGKFIAYETTIPTPTFQSFDDVEKYVHPTIKSKEIYSTDVILQNGKMYVKPLSLALVGIPVTICKLIQTEIQERLNSDELNRINT